MVSREPSSVCVLESDSNVSKHYSALKKQKFFDSASRLTLLYSSARKADKEGLIVDYLRKKFDAKQRLFIAEWAKILCTDGAA